MRCFPSLNCAEVHWGRRFWWRFRRFRGLWAVVLIMSIFCSNYKHHCCQNIEWIGRQVLIVQAWWKIWELPSKSIWQFGSFEWESIVTICGPGDAIDVIDIISRVSLPDISVELRTIGVFGLGGLGSLDDCSTWNTSESIDLIDILKAMFKRFKFENWRNILSIAATK